MNQIYTGEKKSISIFNENPVTENGPSDMVIQNILSYSAALKVEKTKKNAIKLETIQVILN